MTNQAKVPQDSLIEEIKALVKSVNDLESLFNQQRRALKERGVDIPVGAQLGLQELRNNLEKLAKSSEESQIELQRLRALSRTAELVNAQRAWVAGAVKEVPRVKSAIAHIFEEPAVELVGPGFGDNADLPARSCAVFRRIVARLHSELLNVLEARLEPEG